MKEIDVAKYRYPLSPLLLSEIEEILTTEASEGLKLSAGTRTRLFNAANKTLLDEIARKPDDKMGQFRLQQRRSDIAALFHEATMEEHMPVKDRAIKHLARTVKREERNINLVMDVCLSAYTDDPINTVLQAQSASGKTFLVKNVADIFPPEDVIMLRSATQKSFSRDQGVDALKKINPDGSYEFKTTWYNDWVGKEQTVSEYVAFINYNLKAAEKAKNNPDKKAEEEERVEEVPVEWLTEKSEEIAENGGVYQLIDFTNKILIFIERPDPKLWEDLLSVLSHDAEYTVSQFTSGQRWENVTKVVFRHWPAVIFATTNPKELNWGDIKTRFEVLEPIETKQKTIEAVDSALQKQFGLPEETTRERISVRRQIKKLVRTLEEGDLQNPLTPFAPQKLRDTVNELPDIMGIMRTYPRMTQHLVIDTLFRTGDEGVKVKIRDKWHPLVSRKNLEYFSQFLVGPKMGSMLTGLKESLYELYFDVLIPYAEMEGTDDFDHKVLAEQVEKYAADRKGETKIKGSKASISRYLKDLSQKGYIWLEKDEKTHRTHTVHLIRQDSVSSVVPDFVPTLVSSLFQDGNFDQIMAQITAIDFGKKGVVPPAPGNVSERAKTTPVSVVEDIIKIQSNTEFYRNEILSRLGYVPTKWNRLGTEVGTESGTGFRDWRRGFTHIPGSWWNRNKKWNRQQR